MKVELDLPEIEGFEYTGEYRSPVKGDRYYYDGNQLLAGAAQHDNHPILKKKEPEYKVKKLCEIDDQDGPGTVKYVSINALADALVLIDENSLEIGLEVTIFNKLKELIK